MCFLLYRLLLVFLNQIKNAGYKLISWIQKKILLFTCLILLFLFCVYFIMIIIRKYTDATDASKKYLIDRTAVSTVFKTTGLK